MRIPADRARSILSWKGLIDRTLRAFQDPESAHVWIATAIVVSVASGYALDTFVRIRLALPADGPATFLRFVSSALLSLPVLYFAVVRPLTAEIGARIAAEKSLRESHGHVLRLLDKLPVHVWRCDETGAVDYVNSSLLDFLGRSLVQLRGHAWTHRVHRDDRARVIALRRSFSRREPMDAVVRVHRGDGVYRWFVIEGSPYCDSTGAFTGYIGVCIDITEQRDSRERLNRMAYYDELTQLPNRALFKDRLSQALASARRRQRLVAVALLDLDGFKEVNDTLGHDAGDRLLRSVAARLMEQARESDSVCRIGGDEFVVILTDLPEVASAERGVKRLFDAFAHPMRIDEHELYVSASVGVSIFPNDASDTATLFKHADMAMYKAKESGKNGYRFFSDDLNVSVSRRAMLSNELRRAVSRREFVLYYQPQVDLATQRIVGVEALVRWRHPRLGTITPEHFVELAEEIGVICDIDDWVLASACEQVALWQRSGATGLRLSVNVSPKQFQRGDLVDVVSAALGSSRLPASSLELEITERTAMQDTESSLAIMRELHERGIRIAIDDFGTGHSSLAYLKRFPISAIKIDGSFIRDIPVDQDDIAIVSTIVAMAKTLRVGVVGEAVETPEQLGLLTRLQCDIAQGYLLGHPIPACSFAGLHLGFPSHDRRVTISPLHPSRARRSIAVRQTWRRDDPDRV